MDNPWAESWQETSKKDIVDEPQLPVASTWTAPTKLNDVASDTTIPSWTTSDAPWGAPEPDHRTDSWGKEPVYEPTWEPEPATFIGFPITTDDTPKLDGSSFAGHDDPKPSPPSPESGSEPSPPQSPVVLSRAIVRQVAIISDDGDGFGSFTTAGEDEVNTWVRTGNALGNTNSTGGDVWGNSWEQQQNELEEIADDEWATAKQEKAKQDKHVPPECLNAILEEFQKIAADLWPEGPQTSSPEQLEPGRTAELDNVVSPSTKLIIVPEGLSLAMSKPFIQTSISKREVEALKLSRNDIVTRKGPMAMYMAAKGSTSWEASVKTKTEPSQTDAAPAGWKIVSKDEQVLDDSKQKKATGGSGILSFFSRRATSTSTSDETRPASPAVTTPTSSHSRTTSIDVPVTSSPGPAKPTPVAVSTASVDASNPTHNVSVKSPDSALDFFPAESKDRDSVTPPPSVVSRFLGRFGRNSRSNTGRDSLNLSAGDLEFLSDVVPTTQTGASHDNQLKALTSMINSTSPALPTALPPPLAPPPRPTQTKPLQVAPPSTPASQTRTAPDIDLFSSFDAPEVTGDSSHKQSQPSPLIPPSNSLHLLNNSTSFTSTSNVSLGSSFGSPSSTLFSLDSKDSLSSLSLSAARLSAPPLPPPKSKFVTSATSSISPSPASSRPTTPSSFHRSNQSMPVFPPPPSSRSRTPMSSLISPLPPPPSYERTHTPSLAANGSSTHSQVQPSIVEVDDDFDDFVTSPTNSQLQTNPPSFSSFTQPSSSYVPHKQVDNSFDGFGDFSDFGLAPTPAVSIPITPSQQTSSRFSSTLSRSSSPHGNSTLSSSPKVKVSRADHQRTLSLLETAASRGGKWLSPPSPLPMALPPPGAPATKNIDPFEQGFFAGEQDKTTSLATPTLTTLQPPSIPTPPVKVSAPTPWKFPAPPANNSVTVQSRPTPPPISFNPPRSNANIATPGPPKTSILAPTIPTAPASSAKGGLSAQDLAFFEGL